MTPRLRALCLVVAGLASSSQATDAQSATVNPQCTASSPALLASQDACQKAVDLFQFLSPQLGVSIVGGNAVSGESSTLRGLGHLSVGLRVNGLQSRLPRIGDHTPSVTGAGSDDYTIRSQAIGAPAVDAAIGLFRGFDVAGSNALGLDALVNVAYIPSVNTSGLDVGVSGGSLRLGFGGRLGVLRETLLTPGISVTYLRRDLPTVDVVGEVGPDELSVRNAQVETTAWRVVAGKHLGLIGFTIGAGQDRYDTSAEVSATVHRFGQTFESATVAATQTLTRDNLFGDVALDLTMFHLVAELGRVSGGRVQTYNTFSGDAAADPLIYASLGIRLAW